MHIRNVTLVQLGEGTQKSIYRTLSAETYNFKYCSCFAYLEKSIFFSICNNLDIIIESQQ